MTCLPYILAAMNCGDFAGWCVVAFLALGTLFILAVVGSLVWRGELKWSWKRFMFVPTKLPPLILALCLLAFAGGCVPATQYHAKAREAATLTRQLDLAREQIATLSEPRVNLFDPTDNAPRVPVPTYPDSLFPEGK